MAQALSRCSSSLPPLHVLRTDAGDDLPSVASLLPATASAPVFQALPEATLATICFTSGTSGRPKGVMLSHGNIIANVTSCEETRMARSDDTFLSILPLSHMFERTGGYYLPLSLGGKVAFSRGAAQIPEDLAGLGPRVIFAVPRLLDEVLARIAQTLSGLPARGGNIMLGYWGNPEGTRAAVDGEGWLHTGDIAERREGRIYIRGRLKDILVMSNGEKLPPQDVEFALAHDPMFEQVMLVGEGRPFLTLLTVTRETDEKVLLDRANELLKNFPRWVRIRKVIPTQDLCSIDNGLLTPTLKLHPPLGRSRFKNAV